MYNGIYVQIDKCTHLHMFISINIHMYKCMMYKCIMYKCIMYTCTIYKGSPLAELTFLIRTVELSFFVQSYSKLRIMEKSTFGLFISPPSGAHFPSVLTTFKTALVSIIFILELSVLDKSCLELNFQAKGIISRVPCTAVFLRSCTSDFQY